MGQRLPRPGQIITPGAPSPPPHLPSSPASLRPAIVSNLQRNTLTPGEMGQPSSFPCSSRTQPPTSLEQPGQQGRCRQTEPSPALWFPGYESLHSFII